MSGLALLLITATLVITFALFAAGAAAKLARLEGAGYPTAIMRAATAFAAVLTLAAALTCALAAAAGSVD
ncbi:hypothetical protein [Streptomyces sp. NPDC002209]|uniref:hypothetical protein n=1 Tax=Streptomyces sp. NPDC002209 TaxID=3364638 RepID=UPI0036A815F7